MNNTIKITLDEVKKTSIEIKDKTSFRNLETLNIISKYLIQSNYNTLKGIADKNSSIIEINTNIIEKLKSKTTQLNNKDLEEVVKSLLSLLLTKQNKKDIVKNQIRHINAFNKKRLYLYTLKDQVILKTIYLAVNANNTDIDFIRKSYNRFSGKELSLKDLSITIQKYLDFNKYSVSQKTYLEKINPNLKFKDFSRQELEEALNELTREVREHKLNIEKEYKRGKYKLRDLYKIS